MWYNNNTEREVINMLKFKIKALIYAIGELRYETISSFKTNYRNRLISQLIENTHLYSEVFCAMFKKISEQELNTLANNYYGIGKVR
jgi:hypothetical protein